MEPVKCPFCSPFSDEIVTKNNLCYALWDRYPMSKGHMLIIPFRHVQDFFGMTDEERAATMQLVMECRTVIEDNFRPVGYKIGFNVGEAAGQVVMHCHCHVIPCYKGDTYFPGDRSR
jgi:diadenosine tetraphosphate (Ap4A) HIT family hydrolase